jgi:hypothetical protein
MKTALTALLLSYIMPSHGVLKRFANQRDELSISSLKAIGVATVAPVLAREVAALLGTNWNSGDLNLNAALLVQFPGRCRLELSSSESTKQLAAAWAAGKKRHEGGEFPALAAALENACALLTQKSSEDGSTRDALNRHLASLKIESKAVSLARFGGTVSYLIGKKSETSPQLWVYKDRFLPSRIRFVSETGTPWDVRFLDYSSQATGEAWPRVIEVWKGNEFQLRVMLLTADLKADLAGVRF